MGRGGPWAGSISVSWEQVGMQILGPTPHLLTQNPWGIRPLMKDPSPLGILQPLRLERHCPGGGLMGLGTPASPRMSPSCPQVAGSCSAPASAQTPAACLEPGPQRAAPRPLPGWYTVALQANCTAGGLRGSPRRRKSPGNGRLWANSGCSFTPRALLMVPTKARKTSAAHPREKGVP